MLDMVQTIIVAILLSGLSTVLVLAVMAMMSPAMFSKRLNSQNGFNTLIMLLVGFQILFVALFFLFPDFSNFIESMLGI